jgi:hypothetical protein
VLALAWLANDWKKLYFRCSYNLLSTLGSGMVLVTKTTKLNQGQGPNPQRPPFSLRAPKNTQINNAVILAVSESGAAMRGHPRTLFNGHPRML